VQPSEQPPKRISGILVEQSSMDKKYRKFGPNLFSNTEEIPDIGVVTLNEMIYQGPYSTVFTTFERHDIVIKYEVECQTTRTHPLIHDYAFSDRAFKLGEISPQPYFLSPAVPLPQRSTMKTDYTLKPQERHKCHVDGGLVRFMVLERVNYCYRQLTPGQISLQHVIMVGKLILDDLSSLHQEGIIHGDIHLGNICRRGDSVVLIDFGLASFTDSLTGEDEKEGFGFVHPALTPWQLQNFPSSPRDDVFKLFFAMVDLLVPRFTSLYKEKSGKDLLEWKSSGDFLDAIDYRKYPNTPLKARFREVFDIIIGLDSPLSPIPYDEISQKWESIVA
jgi:hypothetical protein